VEEMCETKVGNYAKNAPNTKYDSKTEVVEPFAGRSELEVKVDEKTSELSNAEIDKNAVICNFFICDLPFDC
jgi:hypothetical protein